MSEVQSKEIAFYYPGPMWHHDDWIKTMILFFDGIGILLPDYLKGKPEREDPAIAIPLREQGLLHILEPEQIVDKAATEKLSGAMTEIINSGMLDKLNKSGDFHEISYSRMGGYGEAQLAEQLLETLKAKGLARDSEDGKSIPMQPMVRSLILVLLSQILRPHGEKLDAELLHATDRPQLVRSIPHFYVAHPAGPGDLHRNGRLDIFSHGRMATRSFGGFVGNGVRLFAKERSGPGSADRRQSVEELSTQ